jgi:transcriptional regulator with XRE-family HTH domain
MSITTGTALKKIREKSGLSQGELAKKLGYTNPQFVSNIERDACGLPLHKGMAFCKATKTKPKVLRDLLVAEATRKIDKHFHPRKSHVDRATAALL